MWDRVSPSAVTTVSVCVCVCVCERRERGGRRGRVRGSMLCTLYVECFLVSSDVHVEHTYAQIHTKIYRMGRLPA